MINLIALILLLLQPLGGHLRYWSNGAEFALVDGQPVWAGDRQPVRAVHIRGELPAAGTFWSQIETASGHYDFSTWVEAARYAAAHRIPLLVRFYPHLSQFHSSLLPDWVPRISSCPGVSDMRRSDVRDQIASLLRGLEQAIASVRAPDGTGAYAFYEAPYAGWSGEPRSGALRACFSPAEIEDMHLWAENLILNLVGPERMIGNLDRSPDRIAQLVERGVGAFRQDGFMSWAKEIEYAAHLAHPVARQAFDRVVIFEQWGGGFSALYYEPDIHRSPSELLDLAVTKYHASIMGWLGWPVATCSHPPTKPLKYPCTPQQNVAMVERMQERMQAYAPGRLNTWLTNAGYLGDVPPVVTPQPNQVTVSNGTISAVAVTLADTTIWRNGNDFPWIGDTTAAFPIAGLNVFARSRCSGASIASVVPAGSLINPSPYPTLPGEIHVVTGTQPVEVSFACVDVQPPDDSELAELVDSLYSEVEAMKLRMDVQDQLIEDLLNRQAKDEDKHQQQSEIWRNDNER